MDRNKRLFKTTIIYFIGTFGSKILIFFLLPLYSKYLSTEQYGNLNLVTNLLPLIGPIFTLQITDTIFRFLCTAKEDEKQKYISNATFLLLSGLSLFLIIYIPICIFTKFQYSYLFMIYFLMNYIAVFLQQILRGMGKNIDYSITGFISTVVQLLVNILMIKIIYEKSILLATIIGSIVIMIYVLFRIKFFKYVNFKLVSKDILRKMLKYSLPLIPNQISWWFNDTVGLYILRILIGASATGITSLSNKFPTMVATINSIFLLAWTENSIYEYESDDKEKYYSKSLETFTMVMILICSLILPAVKIYFNLFIDEQYEQAIGLVPVMFIAMIFNASASFLGTVYTASMNTKDALYTTIIAAVSNIALDFILIPKLNIYGYALANAISYIIFYIVRKISVSKIVKIKENYKLYMVPFIIFVISSIVYYKLNSTFNIISVVVQLILIIFIYRKVLYNIMQKVKGKIAK